MEASIADGFVAGVLDIAPTLENLNASQTGTTLLNLTGNAAANSLLGNDADNVLDGGLGIDDLSGGNGNDTYIVDLVKEGSGAGAAAPVAQF